ncbi:MULTISPECIES: DUF2997 domain-containing protein [Citricoccus]|uniref:DUF2997 domain-containing protein n=1 Tax=Citricoccus TaxID=169133 RepID=UPI000255EF49|nr:DUF2997 domain-containing protein [Citricoccus sp. CH26A]
METQGRRIVVRVASDGTIAAETQGIKGARCLDYIEVLEALLKAEVTSSAFTAEYRAINAREPSESHHDVQQF